MNTTSLTIDTSGEWLIAGSYCREIVVSQNGQGVLGGTISNWTFAAPFSTSPAVTVPAGAAKLFKGPFQPGSQVAFLASLSGSMTFTGQENPA